MEGIVSIVGAVVREFDADLPLHQVATMEDVVAESFAGSRVMANLLGVFALIALVLAGVGIYGVISYSVAGRTREIGVRVVLGAERSGITRMILGEGARPVLAGVTIGLAGAWYSTRLVESMLFDVQATDPLTFLCAPGGTTGRRNDRESDTCAVRNADRADGGVARGVRAPRFFRPS